MNHTPSEEPTSARLNKVKYWLYLLPFVGLFPSLWTLYKDQGPHSEQIVSRLAVKVGLSWFVIYLLLWLGSLSADEILSFRLLFLNTLFTSGYFLTCFFLMFRVWQGKKPRL